MLLGRGHRGGTALCWVQEGRWGLSFASGLFMPKIACLLPLPWGNSGVGVALGQAGELGQGRGSVSHGDQPSCALGNSLGQQT